MKPQTQLQELATATPDLQELLEDYEWTLRRRSQSIFDRARINHDGRYCRWAGQSEDGRKWKPRKGEKEVRPWRGASDARPHLIDTYIVEDKAKLLVVWQRNKIHVAAQEAHDAELSTRLTQVLRWMRYTQIKEARRETKLLANWFLERGAAVMGTFWERQTQLGYDEVDMETLRTAGALAAQILESGMMPPGVDVTQVQAAAGLPDAILDPAREDAAVAWFGVRYPDVSKSEAREAVLQLHKQGHARFVRPYLKENRPCLLALLPNEEIFIPEDATDLRTARALYRRELLTEATLRERQLSHGWDPAFIDEVVRTQRGNVREGMNTAAALRLAQRTRGMGSLRLSKMFEVVHAYQRLADKKGVLGIYYTCFHAGMTNHSSLRRKAAAYAYHELLNYDHGAYPLTLFERETISRALDESRGYGEIANTFQAQVKAQWDLRVDAASVKTLPPSFHPPGEPPEEWGPGVQIGTSNSDRYGFFEGPAFNPGSKEIEESVRTHADRRFGRVLEDGTNRVAAAAMEQEMADDWMAGWRQVDTQILQLMQQFGPEEIYYRVVGSDQATPMRATREEIQGQFDVSISYNMGNMDLENLKPVFEFFGAVLNWDIGGRIDRDELVSYAFDAFDPSLAERVMRPAQAASQAEVEDEMYSVIPSLTNGMRVDVKPGQAWQLRKDVLERTFMGTPKLRDLYMKDEEVRGAVDERLQELQHQIDQHSVNAQAGRIGGKPAAALG